MGWGVIVYRYGANRASTGQPQLNGRFFKYQPAFTTPQWSCRTEGDERGGKGGGRRGGKGEGERRGLLLCYYIMRC